MFAIVRSGGKQYRVAPGDKIVVEKLAGQAGDSINLTDVLLAGEGAELKSTSGLIVAAEIIAQAKADKVTVFKKKRRHNYRRKRGHRQQHTILRILSIGDEKAKPAKAKPQAAAQSTPEPAEQAAATPKAAPSRSSAATETKAAKPAKLTKPAAAKNSGKTAKPAAAKASGTDAKPEKSTKSAAPAKSGSSTPTKKK